MRKSEIIKQGTPPEGMRKIQYTHRGKPQFDARGMILDKMTDYLMGTGLGPSLR